MHTEVTIFHRTSPNDPNNKFYYIDVRAKDGLGFSYTQSLAMITQEQYEALKGDKAEGPMSETVVGLKLV